MDEADRPRLPTSTGKPGNRNNVRRRLSAKAIERANKTLVEFGIRADRERLSSRPPAHVLLAALRRWRRPGVHGSQIGHEDAAFTLRVYTHAVKRRERLSDAEREQFERAVEWAQWAQTGTNGVDELSGASEVEAEKDTEVPH